MAEEKEIELREVVTIGAMQEQWNPVSDVVELRKRIDLLGPRPDPEELEAARKGIAAIDLALNESLESIHFDEQPPDMSQGEEGRVAKETAERERFQLQAVLHVAELHDLYGRLLREAEAVLEQGSKIKEEQGTEIKEEQGTDEQALLSPPSEPVLTDVGRIINEALGNGSLELVLTSRKLQYVPEVIGQIETLTVLDLSRNRIKDLPDAIATLVNLEKLVVRSNQLEYLPDSIGLLSKLKYLDASNNELRSIPNTIWACNGLLEMNLDMNKLEFLPQSIGSGLESLEKLSVAFNSLSKLPESLCDVVSLKQLVVRFNKLRSLPTAIGKLKNLVLLDVSSNFKDLTSLPESMGDLNELAYLDLSFNQIRELPVSFGRLRNLATFKMDENPLSDPPPDVVKSGMEDTMAYLTERWQRSLEINEDDPQEQPGPFRWIAGLYRSFRGDKQGNRDDDFLNQQL